MNTGHGGNIEETARALGMRSDQILDFSANINPLGPPEWLEPVLYGHIPSLLHYPDPGSSKLVRAAAEKYGCGLDEVIAGNGLSEIIYLLPRALDVKRVFIPCPAYIDYERAAAAAGVPVETVIMPEESAFAPDPKLISPQIRRGDLVFIGHPVNPSGAMAAADGIRSLASAHPDSFFAVDEAFLDFTAEGESLSRNRPGNVIVLLSFTKIYAIPGLRLGAIIGDAAVVEKLRRVQPCWSVNSFAQAVGERALRDQGYLRSTGRYIADLRKSLYRELTELPGVKVYPGSANYLLGRLDGEQTAPKLAERLLPYGIMIRVCGNYRGLDDRYFRVAVRPEGENERLIAAMREVLEGEADGGAAALRASGREHPSGRAARGCTAGNTVRRRADAHAARRSGKTPAIMFQGTCSNAGKSVLTAAFCRIMLQDGYRVAPFKAQNMSLNSFVTADGGEMGRAQVTQAQACRLEPDVRMNPVLLKPNTDTGSQVVLNGKPVGNMDVADYITYKRRAAEAVKDAYDSLASEFDAVVLEGAGSPAEVNLKHHDIVNMRMAEHAGAPVFLVGDIDRGGVFASFIGTCEVLDEWERELLAGFVVNKFRGNEELLEDAYAYMLAKTGKPVVGTVPHIPELGLPEEDSVGFKLGHFDRGENSDGIEIALIDLPHISNFTDFDALRIEPDVRVRTVRKSADLSAAPDAVVIPGSKNVIGDMKYLTKSGIAGRIVELAERGTEIVGICAGFQILGEKIMDPYRIESPGGDTVTGLGLLPIRNTIEKEKTLKRVTVRHLPSGCTVRGYEIHHGIMAPDEKVQDIGAGRGSENGSVWGTYLHGIFDADGFRRWFINKLRDKRGLAPLESTGAVYDIEPALERLAEIVRKHIDIDGMYRAMGIR